MELEEEMKLGADLIEQVKKRIIDEVLEKLRKEYRIVPREQRGKLDKITFTEVMELFGKTRNTVSSWIASGKLPKPNRYGREWKWERSEIVNLFENGFNKQ
tara:strand:- start:189 stop:491 length:303 start_codon:yes stop_codon:yes gene_type:complete